MVRDSVKNGRAIALIVPSCKNNALTERKMSRIKRFQKDRKGNLTPKVLEKDITKSIRDLLWRCDVWHFKHWGGPMSLPGVADLLGVQTVKVSDLVAAGIEEVGVFVAVEVKRPGEKPTKDQEDFLGHIVKHKGRGLWADNPETVVEALGLKAKLFPLFKKG